MRLLSVHSHTDQWRSSCLRYGQRDGSLRHVGFATSRNAVENDVAGRSWDPIFRPNSYSATELGAGGLISYHMSHRRKYQAHPSHNSSYLSAAPKTSSRDQAVREVEESEDSKPRFTRAGRAEEALIHRQRCRTKAITKFSIKQWCLVLASLEQYQRTDRTGNRMGLQESWMMRLRRMQ
ncbi:hypothetical protein KC19_4G198800 [Ceratodon purpureus]|uniref:Uncharacterized protein n=1 Tax=Ceratodon purpureus TaxID=3225 RepID=A0A8T0IBI2_CERPU|nr:hypothetical protein KC19_4G198800 [Ceratodon purpureus]